MKTRTYLCPDCDGYGATAPGCHHFHNDPACDCEVMCDRCDESGVIEATYDEGERLGFQPWDGPIGRSAERLRIKRVDPLVRLAQDRKAGIGHRSAAYAWARRDAMKPVRLPRYTPESYLARLQRTDPVAAEVLAPVLNFLMPRAA
jgi:hypothetical protein